MAEKIPYEQILLENTETPTFLNDQEKQQVKKAIDALKEVKEMLDKAKVITETAKIPSSFKNELETLKNEFRDNYETLTQYNTQVNTAQAITQILNHSNKVQDYRNQFFTLSPSNRYLLICNTIDTYSGANQNEILEKATSLINHLETELTKTKKINSELEAKAAQSVVSNYVKIFEQQEIKNKISANTWLGIAILFTAVSIVFLLLSFSHDWFNITSELNIYENGNQVTKYLYNIPNLVTKLFLISLLIYLISFFFKQFSINRHLQTLNNHKKNALNSFKLFSESLSEKDSSRSALMLQVSKAIYENTSTGYLPSRTKESQAPGIMEITKLVGDSHNG